MAQDEVLALVADERVTLALAREERGVDLRDEQLLLELLRARGDRAVRRDHLRAAPEADPVLVPDAVREDDVERQVLRVEAVHQAARVRGAEVAALGDAAAGAVRGREDDRRARGRVQVRHREMPEVLADRDAGGARGALEAAEALASA